MSQLILAGRNEPGSLHHRTNHALYSLVRSILDSAIEVAGVSLLSVLKLMPSGWRKERKHLVLLS